MNVYGIGDLHFGHRAICKYRPQFNSELEHREALSDLWNDTVLKGGDLVYVLGDAAFTVEGLLSIGKLRGRKILVRGNHDLLPTQMYLAYFEEVYGILKYKHKWLSHAPIHPTELRGKRNVHGHVHVPEPELTADDRYVNLCADHIGFKPVLLNSL